MSRKRQSTRKNARHPPKRLGGRRRKIWFAGAAVVLLGGGGALFLRLAEPSPEPYTNRLQPGAAQGFNVVVVTLDTTRADHIGCYGYEGARTPTLDRLAAEGIRFADAVSPVPLTLPSHSSIFTGLDPPNHGVRNNGEFRLAESKTSLAEVLQEQGYDTAAFVSAFVLNRRYGLNQGFARYDDTVEDGAGTGQGGFSSERIGAKVTDAALRWLKTRNSTKPFFLWVHYFDAHNDYEPPSPYAERFRDRPYDGEIAYADAQLSRLVEALDRPPGSDKTLMILLGDHGESLGEHEEKEHSRTIYDATQHVPLILRCPGLIRGPYVVDDVVVSIVDVFPTVLEMLKIPYDGPSDGINLLKSREHTDRMVYIETLATYLDNGWSPLYGLRRHRDKYIFAPRAEYYDLESDPHELNNLLDGGLSGEATSAVSKLAVELAARLKDSPSAEAVAASALSVDPESLSRLQALGYLSGEGHQETDELPDPKDVLPAWQMLLEAKAAKKAGRLPQALRLAMQVLEVSPNDRSALREIGIIHLQSGRLREAEKFFRRYVNIKPGADALQLLGQIVTRFKRYEEADALLKQALELDPNHGGALIAQGDLFDIRGRPEEARKKYEEAKRLDPVRSTNMANQRIGQLRRR